MLRQIERIDILFRASEYYFLKTLGLPVFYTQEHSMIQYDPQSHIHMGATIQKLYNLVWSSHMVAVHPFHTCSHFSVFLTCAYKYYLTDIQSFNVFLICAYKFYHSRHVVIQCVPHMYIHVQPSTYIQSFSSCHTFIQVLVLPSKHLGIQCLISSHIHTGSQPTYTQPYSVFVFLTHVYTPTSVYNTRHAYIQKYV